MKKFTLTVKATMETDLVYTDEDFTLPDEIDENDQEAVNDYIRQYAKELDGGLFVEEGNGFGGSWNVHDQEIEDNALKGKWIQAFDTICTGWDCVKDQDENPWLFDSKEAAQKDLDEDEAEGIDISEYFIIPASEYIEGRKAIYTGD